jgi:hypothetical protein
MTDLVASDPDSRGPEQPGPNRATSAADRELAIAQLAGAQHGVIARRQLMALGLSGRAVGYRLRIGRIQRIHPGVYAIGHKRLTVEGKRTAAVLACALDALLSHQTAADHWGLLASASARIHVTATSSGRRRVGGVSFHRARRIDPRDRTIKDGIPVTAIPRTLLDLAESVTQPRLQRAFDQSERLGLFDLTAMRDLIERSRGRRGLKPLLALLAASTDPPPDLRSDLEHRFRELCQAHDIPTPAFNVVVEGHTVDAYWPKQRLVVEVDSYAYHRDRDSFENDRKRDVTLQLAGNRVLRVTDRRLEIEPAVVAGSVLAALYPAT